MSKSGEWADHIIVMMTARLLKKDIMILTSSLTSGENSNVTWISCLEEKAGMPLMLGHIWEKHYISLSPKGKVYMIIPVIIKARVLQ